MKTLLCLLSLLWCVNIFLADNDLVGTWVAENPDNGTKTQFQIKADNTYEIDFGADGSIDIKGTYSVEGNVITVKDSDGNCKGKAGKYKFTLTEDKASATMTEVSDACADRSSGEGSSVTLTKV